MIRHVKKRLAARGPLHPAQKQFTVYLGNFIINDDLGVHLCLAMEPLVNFWAAIRGPYKAISVALAKDATRQLLAALCFLHEECGVVHRGMPKITSSLYCVQTKHLEKIYGRKTCSYP